MVLLPLINISFLSSLIMSKHKKQLLEHKYRDVKSKMEKSNVLPKLDRTVKIKRSNMVILISLALEIQ